MSSPMYRQIAEDLREQIESGGLRAGQKLRTEVELRDHYGASRNTVRDAIKLLTTLGLVETRQGQGTYVVEKIDDPFITNLTDDPEIGEGTKYRSQVSEQHRKPYVSPVQVSIQHAPAEVSARLRLPDNAEVISRQELRYIDGKLWSIQTSYYPAEFADRGAERLRQIKNIEEGTVAYLAKALELKQVGYRDWITARTPTATETDGFGLLPGGRVEVFELFRTAFDQHGVPMRLTVTVFPTDRNQFIVNVGKVPEPQYLLDGASTPERNPLG
jgi:GntR family transcriptional regulator